MWNYQVHFNNKYDFFMKSLEFESFFYDPT
jgi:hypothetical protein